MIKEGSYVRCTAEWRRPQLTYGRVVGPEFMLFHSPGCTVALNGSDNRYQIHIHNLVEITEKEYFIYRLRGK